MSTGKSSKEGITDWLDDELRENSDLYEALEGEPEESEVSREDFGY